MTFSLLIYLISVLSGLKAVFITVMIILLLSLTFYLIYITLEEEENEHGIKLAVAAVVFSVLTAITPDEKTAYLMVGAYVAQEVVQSETGDKVVKIINKELDKFLVEDKPTKKE